MKAKEVLKLLGITQQTLWNWSKSGKIKVVSKLSRTYNEYDDDSVYALIGQKSKKEKQISNFICQSINLETKETIR